MRCAREVEFESLQLPAAAGTVNRQDGSRLPRRAVPLQSNASWHLEWESATVIKARRDGRSRMKGANASFSLSNVDVAIKVLG
jgi:hypothetical protein